MDKTLHIVCVDDEDAVRETLERTLTEAFGDTCTIMTAASGDEGLALLEYLSEQNEQVGVVLSDQRMPGMEGVEFLRILQGRYPATKRVLVTAYGQEAELIKRALDVAQVDGFVDKPFFPAEKHLLPLIRRLLGQYQEHYLLEKALAEHKTIDLISLGGATEASIWSIYYPIEQVASDWSSIPYGFPLSNQRVHVLNKDLEPCPDYVPGDLYIGGIGLAMGYWKDPEKDQATFITDPWTGERLYKTGDIGRFLPEGYIEFLGREDSQVKIRGYRIELGEIEATILKDPSVAECVVTAQEDERGDKTLVAYVVPALETTLDHRQIRTTISKELPAYMVPPAWVTLERLPLTGNAKVDLKALPAPQESTAERVAPSTQTERQLAKLWAEILSLKQVGAQDNFFDCGGHSVLAVALMVQIQQRFGVNLPLAVLFRSATLAGLAAEIDQGQSSSWSALVSIQTNGSQVALFCVPGMGGNVLGFQALIQHLGEDQPCYGLQAIGLDGETAPLDSVEETAKENIRAIQTIQPQGPYRLVGHSFGGGVVYEMARQLQQQGQDLALLVLLDSLAPVRALYQQTEDLPDQLWTTEIARMLGHLYGQDLQLDPAQLKGLDQAAQLQQLQTCIQQEIPALAGIDPAQLKGLVQVAASQARMRYCPEVWQVSCPVVLYKAQEILPLPSVCADQAEVIQTLQEQAAMGWDQLVTDQLQIREVPGDHFSMLTEPHVVKLAQALLQDLSN